MVAIVLGFAAMACGRATALPSETRETSPATEAEEILSAFFAALHEGRYADAVALFDGPYDPLFSANPDVDQRDYATLLQRWCTQNGGQCLLVRAVVSTQAVSADEYSIVVQFSDSNGELFAIGPCCGEPDTGQRVIDFPYTVLRIGGSFKVRGLPPYVP